MRISLIGCFAATDDGGDPMIIPPNGARLLVLLALHRQGLTRSCAGGMLWPDKNEERASANLRSTLWRLKSTRSVAIVDREPAVLSLSADVVVDLDELAEELQRPEGGFDLDSLLTGLLEDWNEEWIEPFRIRWRQTRLHAVDRRCRRLFADGHYDEVVDLARRVLAVEPLRESIVRLLVQAENERERPAVAAEVVDGYRTRLRQEFGASMSPQMTALTSTMQRRPPSDQ